MHQTSKTFHEKNKKPSQTSLNRFYSLALVKKHVFKYSSPYPPSVSNDPSLIILYFVKQTESYEEIEPIGTLSFILLVYFA